MINGVGDMEDIVSNEVEEKAEGSGMPRSKLPDEVRQARLLVAILRDV